jgi:hypothetical protein
MESFLSKRIVLQGKWTPPTPAVKPYTKSDEGFWKASRGYFSLPFAFRLPADLPSTTDFKTLFSVNFKVTAYGFFYSFSIQNNGSFVIHVRRSIEYKYHEKIDVVCNHTNALIVEQVDIRQLKQKLQLSRKSNLWMGSGDVTLGCALHSSLVCSGQEVRVDINIDNQSHRKVRSLHCT